MTKCVAYMRYSSDNQTENSIEYQRAAIEAYCKQNGLTLVKEFVDEALTGTSDKRPSFQKMITEASDKSDWDTVLVYDFSRFARNEKDAFYYTALLRDCGKHLVSITHPMDDDEPETALMAGIEHLYNAYFSKKLARVAHAGQNVKAKKAEHCGGKPPLGYDIDEDKHLIINEEEAETVKEIFSLYLNDYSYQQIADILNDRGIRTKRGGRFTKNSFISILGQEKYTGIYIWNRASARKSNHKRNSHHSKPLEQQVRVENGCPVIIEREMFDEVQKKMKERAGGKAESKSRHHYMLGGKHLLKCAVCGRYMTGKSSVSHGKTYFTYTCPDHKAHLCPTKDIPTASLDEQVATMIAERLLKAKYIPQLEALYQKNSKKSETKNLSQKLHGIEASIENLLKLLGNHYTESAAARLDELEKQREELLKEKKKLVVVPQKITEEKLKLMKEKLKKLLMTSDEPEVRTLIKTMVKEIKISNEEVRVILN